MKAIRAHAFGGPDMLVLEDVPVPAPGPGQVLVRVLAAAVNFADVMRRRDDVYPFPTELPYAPGAEVAGVVEAVGDGVATPSVGTSVFGLAGADGSGGYAQYALVGASAAVPVPDGVTVDQAAGLVVAGATATLVLTEVARVQNGETVLVEGAGGGVGGYVVQLARVLGARVIAAAGTSARREAAAAAGADHVVDYTADDWTTRVRDLTDGRGVDVVHHVGGGDLLAQALGVLAPFGRVVVSGRAGGRAALGEDVVERLLYRPALNQSVQAFNLGLWFGGRPEAAGAALRRFVGHVVAGDVTVRVGHTLPLARAAEAHRLVEDRRSTGKVVLRPWED